MPRPVGGLQFLRGERGDRHRRRQQKIPILEKMVDFGAIGVFHQPLLLIVRHGDVRTGLDAGDKARIHLVTKFGDAVGVAL